MQYVDLEFQGAPGIIATAVMSGADGVTLVDPGPSTTLPALDRGLRRYGLDPADVRTILLTHIHLDHAGATGSIVARNPHVRVHVHERGARHLVDPSRLLDSASRLYGDDMDRLWGEVLPVPEANVRALRGGERLDLAGRRFDVMYTPGHASHHVSFIDLDEGVAYVGDTAGIRRVEALFVMPPAPPPDIDLEAWRDSLARILSRRPDALFITHFGMWTGAEAHARDLLARLDEWSARVRGSLSDGDSDEQRAAAFADEVRAEIRVRLSADEAMQYERAARFDYSWSGLARYWRKQAMAGPAA